MQHTVLKELCCDAAAILDLCLSVFALHCGVYNPACSQVLGDLICCGENMRCGQQASAMAHQPLTT